MDYSFRDNFFFRQQFSVEIDFSHEIRIKLEIVTLKKSFVKKIDWAHPGIEPGSLAPEANIIPLDQRADSYSSILAMCYGAHGRHI